MSGTRRPATLEELLDEFGRRGVVSLARRTWERLADAFEVERREDTGLTGEIVLLRRDGAETAEWFVLEQPRKDEIVLRRFATREEAETFVADRLAAYERLWDG